VIIITVVITAIRYSSCRHAALRLWPGESTGRRRRIDWELILYVLNCLFAFAVARCQWKCNL
jgi:hypothetical protein